MDGDMEVKRLSGSACHAFASSLCQHPWQDYLLSSKGVWPMKAPSFSESRSTSEVAQKVSALIIVFFVMQSAHWCIRWLRVFWHSWRLTTVSSKCLFSSNIFFKNNIRHFAVLYLWSLTVHSHHFCLVHFSQTLVRLLRRSGSFVDLWMRNRTLVYLQT